MISVSNIARIKAGLFFVAVSSYQIVEHSLRVDYKVMFSKGIILKLCMYKNHTLYVILL